MNILYLQNEHRALSSAQVATIGFFDGVHRGHRYLIAKVVEAARREGVQSMVVTFDKHPRQVLGDNYRPMLLTTLEEKLQLIAQTGVDNCVVVPFNRTTASLGAYDFMRDILKERLHVQHLVIGYDNRFGHNREEGIDDYRRYGLELGMAVEQNNAFVMNGYRVSSSLVRKLVAEGGVDIAARCLGRPYRVTGTVVKGFQEGRKMGFPTANVDLGNSGKLVPGRGVYAVLAGIEKTDDSFFGMMNIGCRPTFGGTAQTLEVNIFNFSGNLYGKRLTVQFVKRLRGESKFSSPEELKRQLTVDKENAQRVLQLYLETNNKDE